MLGSSKPDRTPLRPSTSYAYTCGRRMHIISRGGGPGAMCRTVRKSAKEVRSQGRSRVSGFMNDASYAVPLQL